MRHRRDRNDERGSVTVLVAAAMVALIGLVALGTDVGRLYIAQERIATVADAAALSGAQFLPGDRAGAINAVKLYLTKNQIDPQSVTISVSDTQRTISVAVTDRVNYTFARVFGQGSGRVDGSATANVAAVTGYDSVVPLGVVQSDWQLGSQVVLKAAPGSGGHQSPGNFGALSLGGKGAATYEANLAHGYTGWVRVGDWLTTETGNMAGPTERAIQARIAQDSYATYGTVRKGSPRIVIIPVLESLSVNGRGEVKVVGFAAFFLERVETQGNDKGSVYGRFLKYVVTGESNGVGGEFATYTIKLTR